MHASTTTAESAAIKSGPGRLIAAGLTGGSDGATLIVYDNTAGSGTVLVKLAAAAGVSVQWTPPGGQVAARGLYAAVTGTAASATVVYG